ncbi:MAG: hypothetical protein ACI4WS_11405 [Oscillospiraceae bacterium]
MARRPRFIETRITAGGFSAVALEIKKLYNDIGVATQQINDITSVIQRAIESVSQQMDQIQDNTGKCIEAMEKTEDIFHDINLNISDVGSDIHDLEISVECLNHNKESIVNKFSDISSGTEELSGASRDICKNVENQNTELKNTSTAMQELSKVIEKLNDIICQFQM